jgi:hypothetical protein
VCVCVCVCVCLEGGRGFGTRNGNKKMLRVSRARPTSKADNLIARSQLSIQCGINNISQLDLNVIDPFIIDGDYTDGL